MGVPSSRTLMEMTSLVHSRALMVNFGADLDRHTRILMEMTSLVPSRALMVNFGADSDRHTRILMEMTSLVPSRALMVNSGADSDPHSRTVMTNSKNDLDLPKMDTDLGVGSGTLIKTTSMDIDMDLH